MDAETRGRLIGMVLGDGYINTTNGKSEISILHAVAQRDYCEHKAGLVKQSLGGAFAVREYANGPGGRYKAVKFVSSHAYWRQLKGWCYPENRKTFTRRVLDMLTPEGIAIWYMDDGHARRNTNRDGRVSSVSTTIATMCSEHDCDVICEYFQNVHSVAWKVRCRKSSGSDKAFYLECNTENTRKFVRLIRAYIIPSMLYKITHVTDLESHECRAHIGNCTKCAGKLFDNRRAGLCSACYSRRYYREVRRHVEGRKPASRGFYKQDM